MGNHEAAMETDMLAGHMTVVEHCARTMTPDGMPRTPGSILITTRGAAWVVQVVDFAGHRWFTCLAMSIDGALRAAEDLLSSDSPPWIMTRSGKLPAIDGRL